MSNQVLERKEYLVGITIYEGRNIIGKDSQGTSDPFLKIRCADQIQQSQKKYEQNSAVWNQSLTFNGLHMNQYELETFELIIELYDHNAITQNELIGQYSIGLSTLHRSLGHEFYKTWIGVFNPEEPNSVQGYLLISCFIVGPNERPPIHSADDEVLEDQESEEQDEEEVARRIENIKRAQGIVQVNNPSFIIKNYQLSAVVQKVENLPLLAGDMVYPFVSVRVNGCVLTTKSGSKRDAIFNNKLDFPITYPILNDKITVRMWSKNSKFTANTFIANIPEHPEESDNFNLSQLLRQDGRMKARWFNMYGTHPSERTLKTKGRREGSTYLGRVLIQFSLIPNDYPNLQAHHSNNIIEPRQDNYLLNVDLYEWSGCDFESNEKDMWVVITQGNFMTEPQKAKKMKKVGTNSYNFAVKKVPELRVDFPCDHDQIPDIIINFFCNKGEEPETKIGYIRLMAVEVMGRNPKPQWIRIKSPTNDITGGKPGQILCNVNFYRYNPLMGIPDRPFKDKSGKQPYRFYYQVINGFELATAIDEEKLNTRVEIQIGGAVNKKLVTKTCKGRYPQWLETKHTDIMLEKELSFESDLKISVINEIPQTQFSKKQDQIIGELSISLDSIMKHCDRPQYFNLINEEEQFVGSILCNFLVKFYPKDMKKKFEKIDDKLEHQQIDRQFKSITETIDDRLNISFSVFGIRNLMFECYKPEIHVYLTNDQGKENVRIFTLTDLTNPQDNYDDDPQVLDKHNPNFSNKVEFKDVQLYKEPLMWPQIQVCVVDKGSGGYVRGQKGCENTFTTISILDYVNTLKDSEILTEEDYHYARLQLNRNQDHVQFVQEQIQPKAFLIQNDQGHLFFRGEDSEGIEEEEGNDVFQDNTQGADVGDKRMSFKLNRQTITRVTVAGVLMRATSKPTDNNWMFQKLNEFRKTHHGGAVDADEIDFDFHEQYLNADNEDCVQDDEASNNGDDIMPMKQKNSGQGDALQRQLDTGIQIGEIEVHKVDKSKKDNEKRERNDLIQYYKSELRGLARKLESLSENQIGHAKDLIQMHMLRKQEEIEELESEEMTPQKFWGMLGANKDEDDDFDYGREFLKGQGQTFDHQLLLPYEEIRLFLKPDWFKSGSGKEVIKVGGVLRSGILAQSVLKAAIDVETEIIPKDEKGEYLLQEIEYYNDENEDYLRE